ncbi:hypothetical protein ACIGGF_12285 [Rhodococcus sp. NPDC078407]|uniref:hypothetical protein n=1 Tax=Rhodococcus sp. NPDC078407 TaxID=3364509 RepID=UPI0037C81387
MLDDASSFELLQNMHRRFKSPTYVPDHRDRADLELIKTTSMFRIAEALSTIDARLSRAEKQDQRWP